jgi:hypothetical protein
MNWTCPFVIYRIDEQGKILEVFKAEDLKKAKYWLTYIAQPGDVLCKTPLHPKHSQSKKSPEYWSHKEQSGKLMTSEESWIKAVKKKSNEEQIVFPENENTVLS